MKRFLIFIFILIGILGAIIIIKDVQRTKKAAVDDDIKAEVNSSGEIKESEKEYVFEEKDLEEYLNFSDSISLNWSQAEGNTYYKVRSGDLFVSKELISGDIEVDTSEHKVQIEGNRNILKVAKFDFSSRANTEETCDVIVALDDMQYGVINKTSDSSYDIEIIDPFLYYTKILLKGEYLTENRDGKLDIGALYSSPENKYGLIINFLLEEDNCVTTGVNDVKIDTDNKKIIYPYDEEESGFVRPFETSLLKDISYDLNYKTKKATMYITFNDGREFVMEKY
jgi:hypothetical protein